MSERKLCYLSYTLKLQDWNSSLAAILVRSLQRWCYLGLGRSLSTRMPSPTSLTWSLYSSDVLWFLPMVPKWAATLTKEGLYFKSNIKRKSFTSCKSQGLKPPVNLEELWPLPSHHFPIYSGTKRPVFNLASFWSVLLLYCWKVLILFAENCHNCSRVRSLLNELHKS